MVIVDCTPEDPAPLDPTPRADAKVTKQGAGKKAEGQHMEDSDASTSSAADEKAKLHAQAKRLELWLEENGKNLYPSRPQKERLAKELGMTLLQVTRWFSNRRRKQHKRPKTTASAEDRSKHIQDIVDEVVQRTANGEALQLSSRSMNIDVDEFDESDASDASKENEEHQKDMQETLNDIWIKALKNALSSTAWPQQQQQKPSVDDESKQQQQNESEEKEMVVNVSQSPVASMISAEPCAGKESLIRPTEQHHGFVTPPPSVLPRVDSASSLANGFHQVPDLQHGSPVLTPEHTLQAAAHQPHNELMAQMAMQAGQYWMLQQVAMNPLFLQQYQMQMLALQQHQQKMQQFAAAASPPQTSAAASPPFHVMPTTSTHHDVHVDIEASPPTPESFPGDIDSTISMAMDTTEAVAATHAVMEAACDEDEFSHEELMTKIEEKQLTEKEALAVFVLAGLSCQ